MTATSINALRNRTNSQDEVDDRMDQVRDLLVGDHIRSSEARLNVLEARVRDMETNFSRQIDAISLRMEALAGEVNNEHRTAFNELASNISELGESIRRIAKP